MSERSMRGDGVFEAQEMEHSVMTSKTSQDFFAACPLPISRPTQSAGQHNESSQHELSITGSRGDGVSVD